MPVADTSSIVDILRRDPRAIRLYETCEEEGTSLFATVVTAMELYKGRTLQRTAGMWKKSGGILELFTILPIDDSLYEAFGQLAAMVSRAGNPVGDFDEAIAAIVLCSDGAIITRGRHFEKIPGLEVIGY